MSVAPISLGSSKINVLDCPGFFDFVGDALCALRAVETGVIVVSAKDTAENVAVGAQRSWKYVKNANLPVMFVVSRGSFPVRGSRGSSSPNATGESWTP